MSGKLCILLLALSVFVVSLNDAVPVKRNIFEQQEMSSREEVVEYLRSVDRKTLESLSDDQIVTLVYLTFMYDLQSEVFKRAGLDSIVKRSLKKRESPAEDEMTREDLINFIKSLNEHDIMYMDKEEKTGLALLIFMYDIKPHELVKRSTLEYFTKRSTPTEEEMTREELIHFMKSLSKNDINNMDQEEKMGLALLLFLYDIQPHELMKRSTLEYVTKRSTEDEMTREDLIEFLKSLTPQDYALMDQEERMGLELLVFMYDVKPHEYIQIRPPPPPPSRRYGKRSVTK